MNWEGKAKMKEEQTEKTRTEIDMCVQLHMAKFDSDMDLHALVDGDGWDDQHKVFTKSKESSREWRMMHGEEKVS